MVICLGVRPPREFQFSTPTKKDNKHGWFQACRRSASPATDRGADRGRLRFRICRASPLRRPSGRLPENRPPEQPIYRPEGDVRSTALAPGSIPPLALRDTIETGDKSEIVFAVGGN